MTQPYQENEFNSELSKFRDFLELNKSQQILDDRAEAGVFSHPPKKGKATRSSVVWLEVE